MIRDGGMMGYFKNIVDITGQKRNHRRKKNRVGGTIGKFNAQNFNKAKKRVRRKNSAAIIAMNSKVLVGSIIK